MLGYALMQIVKTYTALFLLWLIIRYANFEPEKQVKDDLLGRNVPLMVYI